MNVKGIAIVIVIILLALEISAGVDGREKEAKKYDGLIVVATGRSGSTYLMEMLRSLKGVESLGEISVWKNMPQELMGVPQTKKARYMKKKLEVMGDKSLRKLYGRQRDVVMATWTSEQMQDVDVVVGKIISASLHLAYGLTAEDFVEMMREHPRLAVVRLRRNPVETAISWTTVQQKMQMKSGGMDHAFHSSSKHAEEKIAEELKQQPLSLMAASRLYQMTIEQDESWAAILPDCPTYIGEITYEELDASPQIVMAWLLNHLNAPQAHIDQINVGVMCKSTSIVKLEDRYANSEEVKEWVLQIGGESLWNHVNRDPIIRKCRHNPGHNVVTQFKLDKSSKGR